MPKKKKFKTKTYRRSYGDQTKVLQITHAPKNLNKHRAIIKKYFRSHYGSIRDFRLRKKLDESLAEITFYRAVSVINALLDGETHEIPFNPRDHSNFFTICIKSLIPVADLCKMQNNVPKKPRGISVISNATEPSAISTSAGPSATSISMGPSDESNIINKNNSNKLFCTGYSMCIPSLKMDMMLKKYFNRYGQILNIDRPIEKGGKIAIFTFQEPVSVTNIMKKPNHCLHINRFGDYNSLIVGIWDGQHITDDQGNEISFSQTEENTLPIDTSSLKNYNTNQIFCTGFPIKVIGAKPKLLKMLSRYFSSYGEVLEVKFHEKMIGHIVIITFRSSSAVSLVMKYAHKHRIINASQYHCLYVDVFDAKIDASGYVPWTILDHTSGENCIAVSQQIFKLTKSMILEANDYENRNSCLNKVMEHLQPHFPDARMSTFGLSSNNLGYKRCNLDFLFEPYPGFLGNEYIEKTIPSFNGDSPIIGNSVASQSEILKRINLLLNPSNTSNPDTSSLQQEYVNYYNEEMNIRCRIWCRNMLVVYNSDLLKFYTLFDERVIPLIMVIRFWAIHHHMLAETTDDVSKFSDNALTWMIIFFLQNTDPYVLPPVNVLMTCAVKSRKVLNFETAFCEDVSAYSPSTNTTPIEILLWEFFNFYRNYDYSCVICPRSGIALDRKSLLNDNQNKQQFQNSLLCVQDPLETSQNITSNISSEFFCTFFSKCKFASETFNPNEMSNSQEFFLWGIFHLFTALPCFESISLQNWEYFIPENPSKLKFSIQYMDKLTHRIIYKLSREWWNDPKLFYKLVIAALLNIFNRALCFETFILPNWEFKHLEIVSKQQLLSNFQGKTIDDEQNNTIGEEIFSKGRKKNRLEQPDNIFKQSRKLQEKNAECRATCSEIDNATCNMTMKIWTKSDTWSERWKFCLSNEIKPDEIKSIIALDKERKLSLLLSSKKERKLFLTSFMCHCFFSGTKELSIDLECDANLTSTNLLPFLAYFIPLKMETLFCCQPHDLVSHLPINEVFIKEYDF